MVPSMAINGSVRWHHPPLFVSPKPHHLHQTRRSLAQLIKAFGRSDLDGFGCRVASGEALRDAWQSANDGIEILAFEAHKAAERIDCRFAVSRRFDSFSHAATAREREVDQELGIARRLRTFSMDFSRNWPRYRKELSGFLETPIGRGFSVFVFEMEGTAILYQKQFPSQLYSGISSLQFENCNHNGYVKNVLLIAMQDSSIFAIEEDTEIELNTGGVHTKKPSRALLMQILGCQEGEYGKAEIRSLPDLSLLQDVLLGGFLYSTLKSCANTTSAICASPEGELVMVNGDQEILFFSVLFQKGTYRKLEYINQVYKKNIVATEEGCSNVTNAHKEKKKGIFGMVKDLAGNKSKHAQDTNTEDFSESTMEELSAVFSTPNFSLNSVSKKNTVENEVDVELDIDDIDLDDTKGKAKQWNFAVLNKQKFGKKLLAIKGKLKTKTDENLNSSKGNEDDKDIGSVDQIKKKYGYAVNNESTSIAKVAESKLSDNVRKLQGINDRASDMKDTAQSFSSLAKDLLKTVQKDKKSS